MVAPVSNAVLFAADILALLWLWRGADAVRLVLVQVCATVALVAAGRFLWGWGMFAAMQAIAWAAFLHAPALLAVASSRTGRAAPGLLALVLGLLGVEAFVIEPRWLEVTRLELRSDKLDQHVRIALVTDIQTDHVGAYEQRVFAALRAEAPDLVLFAGDYIQTRDNDVFVANAAALAGVMAGLAPPLGAFAVRGDVDAEHWEMVFAGVPVVVVKSSRTVDLGPLVLTALEPADGVSARPPIARTAKFHVAFAHRPDYALAAPPADLLLAGHIHGGQVRVPGFGPLLTLSTVPRAWAVGHTALPGGGDLYVSRGIGMERLDAPRLRLNCRPELAILDLLPGSSRTGG